MALRFKYHLMLRMLYSLINLRLKRCYCIGFALAKVFLFIVGTAIFSNSNAQVVLDGTLGSGGVLQGPDYRISDDLGSTMGSNLFHSFSDFNLSVGESATFSGPDSIANILTRVTGNNASTIDGLLRSTIANADFFFMNPNGVFFGPNAELDVGGSFVVSTSDYIGLADGGRFDAANPEASVLTTAAPNTFGFLDNNPIGMISLQGEDSNSFQPSTLSVKDGQELSLIGGDILIVNGKLLAPNSGGVSVISVGSGGEVVRETDGEVTTIRLDGFNELGEVALSQDSEINVNGVGGGKVTVRAKGLDLDNSDILAETAGNLNGKGMDIHLTGNLILENGSQLSTQSSSNGEGGDTIIKAERILISDPESEINFSTSGNGMGGDVEIETGTLEIINRGKILGIAGGSGVGGSLRINAEAIKLFGVGGNDLITGITTQISFGAPSFQGGHITISVDKLEIKDGAIINSSTFGFGQGGNIIITADDLDIKDGAIIVSSTFSIGNGGDIDIDAEVIKINSEIPNVLTGIATGSFAPPNIQGGNAGALRITADSLLEIVNKDNSLSIPRNRLSGVGISTDTFSTGNGGNLTVTAGQILIDGNGKEAQAGIAARTLPPRPPPEGVTNEFLLTLLQHQGGNAGEVHVDVESSLRIINGGGISADTQTTGNGGTLTVHANRLEIDGNGAESGIVSNSLCINAQNPLRETCNLEIPAGKAGNVHVIVDTVLELFDQGNIAASTLTSADGGELTVEAQEIRIIGNGLGRDTGIGSISLSEHGGDSGNLIVIAQGGLDLQNGGGILTDTSGLGNGGSLIVEAAEVRIDGQGVEETGIGTRSLNSTIGGPAGDLNITVGGRVEIRNRGRVSTESRSSGAGGKISIDAEEIVVIGENAETFANTGILSEAAQQSAGDITLTAGTRIELQSGQIIARAREDGGNIVLRSGREITLDGGSQITTGAGNDGGDIDIRAPSLIHFTDSVVTAQAENNGGNIFIDPEFFILERSDLLATAVNGDGGNITVEARIFLPSSDSTIDASSEFGVDGNIEVVSPESDIIGSLIQLPSNFLTAESFLPERCSARLPDDFSSFIVVGSGGMPVQPGKGIVGFSGGDSVQNRIDPQ